MKKTKIVATIGPASEQEDVFSQLVQKGLNVARLNFSHGNHEEHAERISMIKKVRDGLRMPVAIMLDTKGPEIRTGSLSTESVTLKEGQEYHLTTIPYLGDETMCQVSYESLPKDVVEGDMILIDDGLVGLQVLDKTDTSVRCLVLNGGTIKNHKGVNVPGVKINLPALTHKDRADICFGIEQDVDYIAASFVRKASDVLALRELLENNGGEQIKIVSKIENQEGVDNIDEIIRLSDGVMVARGDLGVEIPTEQVPIVQKMIIEKCNRVGKAVITATQMLDSMIRFPRPTRAEATDVANAILDGTDAIMLSGETAAGKYPIEAMDTMKRIAVKTEQALDHKVLLDRYAHTRTEGVTHAVSHATCAMAHDLDVDAVVTMTTSGLTPTQVSRFRPKAPIIALTPNPGIMRQLSLQWGVHPVQIDTFNASEDIFDKAVSESKKAGFIKDGHRVVITTGVPLGVAGATNLMKVQLVGEVLAKGQGFGKAPVTGQSRWITSSCYTGDFQTGDILISYGTDKEMMPLIEKAAAVIVEKGGLTSHAAIMALNLNIPVIIGVEDLMEKVNDGISITVDPQSGTVFKTEQ